MNLTGPSSACSHKIEFIHIRRVYKGHPYHYFSITNQTSTLTLDLGFRQAAR